MDLRNKAGKLLFEKDLDLDKDTKVSDILDLMMEFGKLCGELGFVEGRASTLIHTTREEFVKKYFN